MKTMRMEIEVTNVTELLGSCSGNPALHKEFVTSKSADSEKMAEELAALPAYEAFEKARTIFPRDASGKVIIWDYQFKGFLKAALGVYAELADKELRVGKSKLSRYTYKRIADAFLFVSPRQMTLDAAPLSDLTRPLRADTMQGPRVALATSERVDAGGKFRAVIVCFMPELMELVPELLDYGAYCGLGQWRNGGYGRFTWTRVEAAA